METRYLEGKLLRRDLPIGKLRRYLTSTIMKAPKPLNGVVAALLSPAAIYIVISQEEVSGAHTGLYTTEYQASDVYRGPRKKPQSNKKNAPHLGQVNLSD